jgi:hypothetical protein
VVVVKVVRWVAQFSCGREKVDLKIFSCTSTRNQATGFFIGSGGAILILSGTLTIQTCNFQGNTARNICSLCAISGTDCITDTDCPAGEFCLGASGGAIYAFNLFSRVSLNPQTSTTIMPQVGIGGSLVVESRKNGHFFRGIIWWNYLVGSSGFSRPPSRPLVAAPPRAPPRALGSGHPAPHRHDIPTGSFLTCYFSARSPKGHPLQCI